VSVAAVWEYQYAPLLNRSTIPNYTVSFSSYLIAIEYWTSLRLHVVASSCSGYVVESCFYRSSNTMFPTNTLTNFDGVYNVRVLLIEVKMLVRSGSRRKSRQMREIQRLTRPVWSTNPFFNLLHFFGRVLKCLSSRMSISVNKMY